MINAPLNSDDNTLFTFSNNILKGTHPLSLSELPETINHQYCRLGYLLPGAVIIKLAGINSWAYYAMPLLFSLFGFFLIIHIASEFVSFGEVIVLGLLLIFFPMETQHSSNFLVDLPASFLSVLAIFLSCKLIDKNEQKYLKNAVIIALLTFWAYLLRINTMPVLVVCYCFLGIEKKFRKTLLFIIFFLIVLFLFEQLTYMVKGGTFGFRWLMVKKALKIYAGSRPKEEIIT